MLDLIFRLIYFCISDRIYTCVIHSNDLNISVDLIPKRRLSPGSEFPQNVEFIRRYFIFSELTALCSSYNLEE